MYTRAGYRFRCPDSIPNFLITFSEYSFNTKVIDISKKWTVNISLQMVNNKKKLRTTGYSFFVYGPFLNNNRDL